jgi:hypothetical protein
MSSDQFENDEVSMVDVLAEDTELEAEANAVFGDSDDQHCTYEKVSFLCCCCFIYVNVKIFCINVLLVLL